MNLTAHQANRQGQAACASVVATTSSRSVTNTVSPFRTRRRYSDSLDLSCLTPTDFIMLMVATGGYKINRRISIDLDDVEVSSSRRLRPSVTAPLHGTHSPAADRHCAK